MQCVSTRHYAVARCTPTNHARPLLRRFGRNQARSAAAPLFRWPGTWFRMERQSPAHIIYCPASPCGRDGDMHINHAGGTVVHDHALSSPAAICKPLSHAAAVLVGCEDGSVAAVDSTSCKQLWHLPAAPAPQPRPQNASRSSKGAPQPDRAIYANLPTVPSALTQYLLSPRPHLTLWGQKYLHRLQYWRKAACSRHVCFRHCSITALVDTVMLHPARPPPFGVWLECCPAMLRSACVHSGLH